LGSEEDPMKVVLGADGTEEGEHALEWCLDHLGPGDEVVAVVGMDAVGEFVLGVPPFDAFATERELVGRVQLDYCEPLAQRGVASRAQLAAHGLARALTDVAAREHADLLVVGKVPHGAVFDAVRGEVAVHLVHQPPCPLLVVPTDAQRSGARER
jgi:nucleotide-binding universal stress UspA family protein